MIDSIHISGMNEPDQDVFREALAAIQANQLNLAHRLLLQILEAEPENIQIMLLLGWTASTSASADYYFNNILERHPDNPLAHEIVESLSRRSGMGAGKSKSSINETRDLVKKVITHLESSESESRIGDKASNLVESQTIGGNSRLMEMQLDRKIASQVSIPKNIAIALAYLVALAVAETLTTLSNPQLGLILHGLILVGLILHAALFSQRAQQRFLITLTLAPLIRLMSLSMPLLNFPQIYWYAVIGIPLFLAVFIVLRMTGFKATDIGLNGRALPWQLLVGLCGLGLGYLEYIILRPEPLIKNPTWLQFWIACLILLIFTGFLEEVIFRGLIQRGAAGTLGRYSVLYVSALFAILHLGYRSAWDLLFVFIVALFFGFVVGRTGSLLGVTLSHGVTNISLYILLPLLLNPSTSTVAATPPTNPNTGALTIVWPMPDEITNLKARNDSNNWVMDWNIGNNSIENNPTSRPRGPLPEDGCPATPLRWDPDLQDEPFVMKGHPPHELKATRQVNSTDGNTGSPWNRWHKDYAKQFG